MGPGTVYASITGAQHRCSADEADWSREVGMTGPMKANTTMSITTLFGTRLLSGLGALAIAGSLAGGTAIAGNPSRSDEAKGKGKGREVAELRHDLKDQVGPERDAIADLRRALADEYAKADPNEAELQRLHDAIQVHRDTISDMKHAALVEMHDELTPEQRADVAERIAKGKGHGKAKGKDKAKGKGKSEAKRDGKSDGKAKAEDKAKSKGKAKAKAEASDDAR
jgi:hypothetical protein